MRLVPGISHHILRNITNGPKSPKLSLGLYDGRAKKNPNRVAVRNQHMQKTICSKNCPLSDDPVTQSMSRHSPDKNLLSTHVLFPTFCYKHQLSYIFISESESALLAVYAYTYKEIWLWFFSCSQRTYTEVFFYTLNVSIVIFILFLIMELVLVSILNGI